MNNAHAFLPGRLGGPAGPGARAARLYLPGNECIYLISGYDTGVDPNARASAAPQQAAGFAAPRRRRRRRRRRRTRAGATATVLVPVYSRVDAGTTIPPDVVDPGLRQHRATGLPGRSC